MVGIAAYLALSHGGFALDRTAAFVVSIATNAIAATVVLAGVAVGDAARDRGRPAELPSPRAGGPS